MTGTSEKVLPAVIQGGMGVAVSGWRLASAVARAGGLGVVSGVALDTVLARRLQLGDPQGDVRRAMAAFPDPAVAGRVLDRYFVPGGLADGKAFRPVSKLGVRTRVARDELIAVGAFVEVHLAKEGHDGVVGINLLEKIQLATPATLYGAMLAGVDAVLMGAGVPSEIPALLDRLAAGQPGFVGVDVVGDGGEPQSVLLDPAALLADPPATLPRPRFLAIIATEVLATYLCRDPLTTPDGFVVEGPTAGGHSAPPRGRLTLDDEGQPVYGVRDVPRLDRLTAIGLPFWLAGGRAERGAVDAARAAGAMGVQVGTAFALSRESGLVDGVRRRILTSADAGTLRVRNDPRASPTGFPFKVVELPGTAWDPAVQASRAPLCDQGYLRTPYRTANGEVGYRCPSEPVDAYVAKGGEAADTEGRLCLCNGLLATVGLAQRRADAAVDGVEPMLVTLGEDTSFLADLPRDADGTYGAADVVAFLSAPAPAPAPSDPDLLATASA